MLVKDLKKIKMRSLIPCKFKDHFNIEKLYFQKIYINRKKLIIDIKVTFKTC